MGFSTVMWRMKLYSSDTSVRLIAVRNLGLNRAFEPLVKAMSDPYEPVASAAAQALSDLGNEGFARLSEALVSDPNVTTRVRVVNTLARSEHKGALGRLVAAIEDSDDQVFEAVCAALERRRSTGCISALHRVLATGSVERRCRVLMVLMAIPDIRSVEPLVVALDHEDGRLRSLAAKALGVFGNARQVAELCSSLESAVDDLDEMETESDRPTANTGRYVRRLRMDPAPN